MCFYSEVLRESLVSLLKKRDLGLPIYFLSSIFGSTLLLDNYRGQNWAYGSKCIHIKADEFCTQFAKSKMEVPVIRKLWVLKRLKA